MLPVTRRRAKCYLYLAHIWENLFNRFDLKYERKRKAPRILTPRLID